MCREREEWSAGRSRRRGERLGRAQDEPKSALQADKVETSMNYQGKVKSPALQNRGQGTQNRLTIHVRATRLILARSREQSAVEDNLSVYLIGSAYWLLAKGISFSHSGN